MGISFPIHRNMKKEVGNHKRQGGIVVSVVDPEQIDHEFDPCQSHSSYPILRFKQKKKT